MFKKVLINVLLAVVMIQGLVGAVFAKERVQESIVTIVDFYYSEDLQRYVVKTSEDTDGFSWVLKAYPIAEDKDNHELVSLLESIYLGKDLVVKFYKDQGEAKVVSADIIWRK